jgi:MFS transporter, ACS family, D-galactonate transporter
VSADLKLRPSRVHQYVLAALCVVAALNYIQRNSISGAEKTIRDDLHLTIEETGNAISLFFLSYALCQIPSGWLAQRISPRWALTLFAAGWSVATMACALATGAKELVWARLVMGVMQAGVFPCATMILLVWYPATRRALATAILNSFMLIGGAIGSMLTATLLGGIPGFLPPLSWRLLFVVFALPGIVWACWFGWWFRNRPSEHSGVNPAELDMLESDRLKFQAADRSARTSQQRERSQGDAMPAPVSAKVDSPAVWSPLNLRGTLYRPVRTALLFLITNPALIFLCLQQFCRAGALRFFDAWFPTYLQEARGLSREHANWLTSLPLLAGVFGGTLGGWVSDTVLLYTGSRRAGRQGVALASLLGCCACYAVGFAIPDVTLSVVMVSVGVFISMFAAPCAYALSMDMSGRNLGIVFGAMNMAGNLGALSFTWMVPRLKTWSGGWTYPVLLFGGMNVAALICWLLLNPEGVIGESTPRTSKEMSPTRP